MRAARSAAMVCGAVFFLGGLVLVPEGADASPPPSEVLLADVGPEFTLVSEDADDSGTFTRTFQNANAQLALTSLAVTDPPGVATLFDLFSQADVGLDSLPEPSLDLAAWLVPSGERPGENGSAVLVFATRSHLFVFALISDGTLGIDAAAFVRALADRQIAATAEGPPPVELPDPDRSDAEAELVTFLPDTPAGFDLSAATVTGTDEIAAADDLDPEVVDFLNNRSHSATRLWTDETGELTGAVSITRYPYDIIAAAHLGIAANATNVDIVSTDAIPDVPDVVAYVGVGDKADQIGATFRRGDLLVMVLTEHSGDVSAERAAAFTADLTRATAAGLPVGATDLYRFPDTPSKLMGLGLTAAIVTAAAAASTTIARLRARRVRQAWSGGKLPPPTAGGDGEGTAIALDADAQRLRRQGAIVAIGQLLTVNVIIVALAGDFAWRGVIVAVIALVIGLVLTHWWQRRELGLLGAKAPPRELVLPRPTGAMVGILALAVLGLGVAYVLKGLRYVVLPPSLAQLKWSDLLGIAPRTVGIVFGIAGFVVAVIGAWLFRLARALSRARTKRALEVDSRRAALYLRSFDDDNLPLPSIASARRPLFELFSLRGADPFEESLAWELNTYGPVVAVGRPGRSLASLGAAREHLADDTWRDQVANRMEEAGVIAVATGETDGLAWELGQVVNGGHLQKTFFVFPPVAPDAVGRRWEHTAASLTEAGQTVGPLPVPASLIHTVRLDTDGTVNVTFASRRDEATYRTAVDYALSPEEPRVDPA